MNLIDLGAIQYLFYLCFTIYGMMTPSDIIINGFHLHAIKIELPPYGVMSFFSNLDIWIDYLVD